MTEPLETLVITRVEYEKLKEDSEWLHCLEGAGVDNWEGYEVAQEMKNEDGNT